MFAYLIDALWWANLLKPSGPLLVHVLALTPRLRRISYAPEHLISSIATWNHICSTNKQVQNSFLIVAQR